MLLHDVDHNDTHVLPLQRPVEVLCLQMTSVRIN